MVAEPVPGAAPDPIGAAPDPIEVTPVVVLFQVFPARPSSIPDIRDFVRRCLAESPLTEDGNREVGETVFKALLDAAGPTGSIHVAFRIFPEHVEVDVLHSESMAQAPGAAAADRAAAERAVARRPAVSVAPGPASSPPGPAENFADWMFDRAPQGGADPGGGRAAARGVGQDGQPVGRRQHRATAQGPAAHPGGLRRGTAEVRYR